MSASRSPLLTVGAFVVVALCWSGFWTFGKLAVADVPPFELAAIRFALAGVLMLAIAIVVHAPLGLARWRLIVVAGAVGIAFYNALVFVALTMGPASDGALVVPTLNPILIALLATAIGEPLTRNKLAGLVVATAGAALLIAGATGMTFSGQRLGADLLYLLCAAAWAVYATLGAILTRSGSPLGVTAVASLVGAAMLFPLGFLEKGYTDVPSWPLGAWLDVAYLVVFATTVGFVLFYWAVQRFGAGMASMVSYLVPIFAVAQAVFILGEQPAPLELFGGAVILMGVRIATLRFVPSSPFEEAEPA